MYLARQWRALPWSSALAARPSQRPEAWRGLLHASTVQYRLAIVGQRQLKLSQQGKGVNRPLSHMPYVTPPEKIELSGFNR